MHHVFAGAGKFVLTCLIVLGFAGRAELETSLNDGSVLSATPSPAEIVASRFPSADAVMPVMPAMAATTGAMAIGHPETFDRGAPSPEVSAEPTWPVAVEPPISEAARKPATAETMKSEPPKAPAANAAPRRGSARSGNVLNDAQIASIKRRLNLTAAQEQLWPAVEAALRKIVYTKNAMDSQSRAAAPANAARTAYIDPTSTEIQQLKYAAFPLIMRLNDEQKREVKMLAYVMGLEAVASQF